MRAVRFQQSSEFTAPPADLWAFHLRPEALQVLAPPLSGFRVLDPGRGVAEGSIAEFSVGFGPLRTRWIALHFAVEPGRSFSDVALAGPFAYWIHEHVIEARSEGCSRLVDRVWFVPPRWLPRVVARLALGAFFTWRHRATRRWLRGNVGGRSGQTTDQYASATGGAEC